jgi:hypothetical protein
MTQQQITDFFKPHAVGFWNATLERLTNDFGTYKSNDDYENETFGEMLDREFWAMGCDYVDYAMIIFNDYFEFENIIDKQKLDELKLIYDELNDNYFNLENFIFETYAMPKIKDIINNGGIL